MKCPSCGSEIQEPYCIDCGFFEVDSQTISELRDLFDSRTKYQGFDGSPKKSNAPIIVGAVAGSFVLAALIYILF